MDSTQKTILLIAKDEAFQTVFKQALSEIGFSLVICATGQQALERIEQHDIDFICCSQHLEDMDGIVLAKQLRTTTHYSYKPFVLITSLDIDGLVEQAYSAGVTDIFQQDKLDELLAFIKRALLVNTQIASRVLYVEEDQAQRQHTQGLLSHKGMEVDAYSSVEEAWTAFLNNDYDVVITDVVLSSSQGGRILVNKIKRYTGSKGDVPILALTTVDNLHSRLKLFQLGISDYIVKPIIADELFIRISGLITRKKLMSDNMDMQLAYLAYNSSSDAILIADSDNKIIAVNPAFCDITGYSKSDVLGKDPSILTSGRHDADFYKELWRSTDDSGSWQGELWTKRKNGEEYVQWLTINTVVNSDNELINRVAVFSDITENHHADEVILQYVNFDALTQLPNRRLFQEHLDHEVKRCQRSGLPLALLLIDIDHFKNINDSLGHDFGDLLLIEVGQRIKDCVRTTDTVARIGGDEFTVILTELDELHRAKQISQKILTALKVPFKLEVNQVHITASIGITVCPYDGGEVTSLLKSADQAMFSAKDLGRNQFCYFTKSMQEYSTKHQALLDDLYDAEAGNQFELYYQPIADGRTGQIVKAETLLRWHHPIQGTIGPAEFIPMAEESGLISSIGDWVFEATIAQAEKWASLAGPDLQLSFNTSPVQYLLKDNHAKWISQLTEIGLPERSVVIEVTEDTLLEQTPKVTKQLVALRNAGIELSIDDFGTGYSSLAYLQKLDVDYIKVDRSFVSNMLPQSDSHVLTEAIVSMAKKLDLRVIAEGVETQQQIQLLRDMDCDYLQGYFFSKPLPVTEFEKLLAQGTSFVN